MRIFIVIVVIIVVVLIVEFYLPKLNREELRKKLYVYPKTENKYLPLRYCKLKCPVTGEWLDAIVYKDIVTEQVYVREKNDFYKKFVKLKDWELKDKNKSDNK